MGTVRIFRCLGKNIQIGGSWNFAKFDSRFLLYVTKGGYLQDVQLCPGGDFSQKGIEGGLLHKTK